MRRRKARLTVTVDPELVRAANAAVAAGRTDSVSSWVNFALTEQAMRERRLSAMAEAIADYEAEFGKITSEEIEIQRRLDRARAIRVRPRRRRKVG